MQSFTHINSTTVLVQPGRYFFGDPCYVVGTTDVTCTVWDRLLDSCDYFNADNKITGTAIGEVDGYQVAAFGTMHGDGTYYPITCLETVFDPKTIGLNAKNSNIDVDSGLIGLVPVEAINKDKIAGYHNDGGGVSLGIWVDITEPTKFYIEDGTFYFGKNSVNTDHDDSDEDDDGRECWGDFDDSDEDQSD